MDEQDAWFTGLYAQFHQQVRGYAWRRVGPDLADEVTSEVFLVAWRRRQELPAVVLPWLLVTARNIVGEHRRRGQRQDAIAAELARCTEVANAAGAEAVAVERIAVFTALAGLSDQDREALVLTVWDGLSMRQAAVVAGCSTAAFAVRLHRARRRLAVALDDLDSEHDDSITLSAQDAEPLTIRRWY